jgi:hypothetical protein
MRERRWASTRFGTGFPSVVLLTVAVCLLVAGCGSAAPGAGTPTDSTSPGSTATPSTATSHASDSSSAPDALNAPDTSQVPVTTAGRALDGGITGDTRDDGALRADAVPLGAEAQVGDWTVKVVTVTAPATDAIAYNNEFNEPPEAGNDYVLVTIEATRTGGPSADFSLEMDSAFIGAGGEEFGAPHGRAEPPQPIDEAGTAGPGQTVSGDLVFEVDREQIAGGMLRLAPATTLDAAVFFALG